MSKNRKITGMLSAVKKKSSLPSLDPSNLTSSQTPTPTSSQTSTSTRSHSTTSRTIDNIPQTQTHTTTEIPHHPSKSFSLPKT